MFSEYSDWIYIGVVVLAFFIFLGWNKSRQRSVKDRKRRNFRQSLKEKRATREKEDEL
jgi:FtsZ-interacting cell division protein ZipA